MDNYPVGLTVREIEQRAWVEGDLKTASLIAAARINPGQDDRYTGSMERFTLAKNRQLPLALEKS
jgi:hypothetical protein